jgi:hypothetical protein
MSWMIRVPSLTKAGKGYFLFVPVSIFALRTTQPPIQWVLGIKWLGNETDHSPPASVKVKNAWSYTLTPKYLHSMVLN